MDGGMRVSLMATVWMAKVLKVEGRAGCGCSWWNHQRVHLRHGKGWLDQACDEAAKRFLIAVVIGREEIEIAGEGNPAGEFS